MTEIKECPVCGETHHELYLKTKDFFLTGEEFNLMQCSGCGFIFTSPRPDDSQLSVYYESDEYLSHHAKGFSLLRLIYQYLRKRNIRKKYQLIHAFVSKGKILDIGCGTGELLSYFKNSSWHTLGIEPDDSARSFAQNTWGLDVFKEDHIEKIQEESFDVVSMWHVLEHVSDINERLKQIHRILKPGSYFFAALPNYLSWDAKHYKEYWAAWDVPRHLFHFSEKNIIQLSEKQGFKFIRSVPMVWDSTYISLVSERNMGNKIPYIKALLNGMKSNRLGKGSSGYSSMIYIFQKD